jgi:hypothetical protein
MRGAATPFRFPLIAALFLVLLWTACSDQVSGPAGPDAPAVTEVEIARALPSALRAQGRLTPDLLASPGVVGSAIALGDDGLPTVVALVEHAGVTVPPGMRVIVTGKLSALDWQAEGQGKPPAEPQGKPPCKKNCDSADDPEPDPRHFTRPVPIGVSTGHPAITAGTIGARVTDGEDVFALSNNHVYANVNLAGTGDAVIQPGTYDGGSSPADNIGRLFAFELIAFGTCANIDINDANIMDAAIALSSTGDLGNATPSAGYGTPRSETMTVLPNMKVKKFGRTTRQTKGTVAAINATVNVGYGGASVACFTGQVIITPGSFSAGGDSGSLVVFDGKGRSSGDDLKTVGLLFAGSSFSTVISPIGPILSHFGVTIDGN